MPESLLNLPEILAAHAQWLADPTTGQRANLTGADLSWADLTGADLTGANLIKADLIKANLTGARLSWANLAEARLSWANLTRANLAGANLTGANLTDADLTMADLPDANLTDANFTDANLPDANLTDADLTDADLTRANLAGANLNGANLNGARGIAIAADAPQRLRAAAAAALQEGALEMADWHSCETTHCLSGWLIHQAGEPGRLLEAAVGPNVAGLMLGGVEAHGHFYDSNEAASEWLRSVLAQPEDLKNDAPTPPPAPAGGLVERVAAAMHPNYPRAFRGEARAAIREVAAWLDLVGNKGSAA